MNVDKSHEILRLKPDASIEDLKLAYRDMVSVWHPDRFLHNPRLRDKAERQLQEINQAYEIALAAMNSDTKDGLKEKTAAAANRPRCRPDKGPLSKPPPVALSFPPVWLARFVARSVDGTLFAIVFGYIGVFQHIRHPVAGRQAFVFAVLILWAFVEANLLSGPGTTPGKWLLGIHVITYQGNKPALLAAFKRSIGVWWYGLGAGILPVMPVMMAVNFLRLARHRPAPWDLKGQFVVVADPPRGYLKFFVALAIVALGCCRLLL